MNSSFYEKKFGIHNSPVRAYYGMVVSRTPEDYYDDVIIIGVWYSMVQ